MKTRLPWIDIVKVICIICVYIVHTENFTRTNTILSILASPFYVNAFFFTNGYLLYKKYLHSNFASTNSLTTLKTRILNCVYKLAIPTIIFSAILYLPKKFFNNQSFDFQTFLIEIFGGVSFWFTSALFIAQITILILFMTKRKNILFYLILTGIIFITLQTFCDFTSQPAINYFPWFWRTGLIYTFIMTIGGMYAKYEDKINIWYLIVLVCASIIGYYMIYTKEIVSCLGLSGRCDVIGFITSLSTTIIITKAAKCLKTNHLLTFVGKNSIIFYFLSGAIPALVSTIIMRINITGAYLLLTTFILSFICSYIFTYIIVKYFSFLIDIRLINKNDTPQA